MKKAVGFLLISIFAWCALGAEGQKDVSAEREVYNVKWVNGVWGSEVDPNEYLAEEVAKHFNIDLNMEFLPQKELNKKYSVLVASGDLPEVLTYIRRDANFVNWVLDGVFYDLTDLFGDYPNLVAEISMETINISTKVQGRIYGLPITKENVYHGLGIRKDWLDHFGLDTPETLDDIFEYAMKVTFEDPDGNGQDDTYGFGLSDSLYTAFAIFRPTFQEAGVQGTSWKVEGKELEYNFLKPGMTDFVAFLRKCYEAGLVDPASLTVRDNENVRSFNNGKYGLINQNLETFAATKKNLIENLPDSRPVPMVIPPVRAGYPLRMSRSGGWFRMVTMTAAVKETDEAREIMGLFDWMLGDGYEFLSFGKEGVHWEGRNAAGIPQLTEAWFATPPLGENWVNLWLMLRRSSPEFIARPEVRGTEDDVELQKNIALVAEYSTLSPPFVESPIDPILTDRRQRAEERALTGVMQIIIGERPLADLKVLQEEFWQEARGALEAENESLK